MKHLKREALAGDFHYVQIDLPPLYSKVNSKQPTKLQYLAIDRMYIRDAVQFDRITRTFEDVIVSSPDVESFELEMEFEATKDFNFDGPDQDCLLLGFCRQIQLKTIDLRRFQEYTEEYQDTFIFFSREEGQQDKR